MEICAAIADIAMINKHTKEKLGILFVFTQILSRYALI